jgi:hypothetical protein
VLLKFGILWIKYCIFYKENVLLEFVVDTWI